MTKGILDKRTPFRHSWTWWIVIWFAVLTQGILVQQHPAANVVTHKRVGGSNQQLEESFSSSSTSEDVIPFMGGWEAQLRGRGLDRFGVADFVLLAKIDGSLEARDRRSGEELWKLEDLQNSGYCVQDLSSSKRAIREANSNKTAAAHGDTKSVKWIVEPTGDGRLYYFSQSAGLQAVPLSIKQLVAQSPFFGTMGGLKMYTGSRRTLLYSIDVRSGKVVQVYGDDEANQNFPAPGDGDGNSTILLGRTEYRLAIHSQDDTLWNITYSSWSPNNMDHDLMDQYRSTLDSVYVQPISDSVVVGVDTQSKTQLWSAQGIDSTVIGVFDALVPRSPPPSSSSMGSKDPGFVVLPQPNPPKQGSGGGEYENEEHQHVYIQRTEQGAWYALSQENYPILVGSAPLAGWRLVNEQQQQDKSRAPRVYDGEEVNALLRGVHDVSYDRYDLVSPRLLIEDGRVENNNNNNNNNNGRRYLEIDGSGRSSYSVGSKTSLFIKSVFASVIALSIAAAVWNKESLYDIVTSRRIMQQQEEEVGMGEAEAAKEEKEEVVIVTQDKEPEMVVPKKPRKRGTRGGRNRGKGNKRKEGEGEEGDEKKKEAAQPETTTTNNNNGGTSLLKVSEEVLGYGSHGTVVLKGEFGRREVAVKRILVDFYEIASHEVKLLQESDHHENVVRYFCMEEKEQFLYIALELCPWTLADVIEGGGGQEENDMRRLIEMDPCKILHQLASGLDHLHFLNIVHRDIKPQNILVAPPLKSAYRDRENPSPRVLLSDFGLCKKLDEGQSSFRATTAQATGTWGWRAPELLCEKQQSGGVEMELVVARGRATRAIDIFSLGCVFYYILTMGMHAFGEDRYMREANIIRGESRIEEEEFHGLAGAPDRKKEAGDLIRGMIEHVAERRIGSGVILKHPLFWSPQKRLDFLLELSDRFEIEPREPPSELLNLLETQVETGVEDDWYKVLDVAFIENLGRYRKYRGDKVLDLLRAMRNKKHHYQDLPLQVQEILGVVPYGFVEYFTQKFPLLVLSGYNLVSRYLSNESCFGGYV